MFIASDQKEDYISKQRVNINCASMCSDVSYSLCHMLVSALCCGIFWPYSRACHWTIIDAGYIHTEAGVVISMADLERVQRVRLNPLSVRFEISYENEIIWSIETNLFHFLGILKKVR